jgi:O-antigen/teichoic acid export membrane protein
MSLKQKAIQGVIWSAIQNWGSQLGSLVVFFVLARLLPPDTFGILAIANLLIAFLQVFIQRGVTESLIQRSSLDPAHLNTAFWMNSVLSLVLMVLTFGSTPIVAAMFNQPLVTAILPVLAIILPLSALSQVQQAVLERQLNFKAIALRQLLATVVSGMVGVGFALLGYGIWSLVAQQVVQELVGAIVLWRVSSWRPQVSVSRSHGIELCQFGIHLLGFNFVNFWNSRADDLLIGYFLGAEALGYYSIAYRILGILQQLLVQTSKQVALPTFSRLQHDLEQFRRAFYKATQLTSVIAFPIFLSVAVLAPELVVMLFGRQWLPSIPVLQVLSFAGLFQSISFFKSAVFVAMGRPAWSFRLSCLSVVLNVVGFAIALRWGIVAVAAAFVIRGYLVFPVGQWAVSRLIHTSMLVYLQQFIVPLMSALAMAGTMLITKEWLQSWVSSPLGLVALCSGVGFITYSLLIYAFSPLLVQELLLITQTIKKTNTSS